MLPGLCVIFCNKIMLKMVVTSLYHVFLKFGKVSWNEMFGCSPYADVICCLGMINVDLKTVVFPIPTHNILRVVMFIMGIRKTSYWHGSMVYFLHRQSIMWKGVSWDSIMMESHENPFHITVFWCLVWAVDCSIVPTCVSWGSAKLPPLKQSLWVLCCWAQLLAVSNCICWPKASPAC